MGKIYTPTVTFEKYGGSVVIDFYEQYGRYRHVYIRRDNGEWLKSVTKATGMLDKPALIPWACKMMAQKLESVAKQNGRLTIKDIFDSINAWRERRDETADLGTAVHDIISEYIKFKLGRRKEMPKLPKEPKDNHPIENAFIAFRTWEKEHDVKFVETEMLVYSKKYNFVGTLDCIAYVDGELCLIDFKSGNGIYWDYVIQVSGYGIAHREEFSQEFKRCCIIRFGKEDANFTMKDFKITPQLDKAFLSCHYLSTAQDDIEALLK